MEQISLFDNGLTFPLTYDDLQALYEKYIYEGEKDEDVFTWSPIKEGRSYSMYGKKVLEFIPGDEKHARLRLFPFSDSEGKTILKPDSSSNLLLFALNRLKETKKAIFRNTVTEEFGCCHDFVRCSDAKRCLHPEDRFYNGCMYRANLEAGRIFYGMNRNVDHERDSIRILSYDVETANNKNIGSICAVGWVLIDGKNILDHGYSLINPRCSFSRYNIAVHGITEPDVAQAPTFAEYWESTLSRLMRNCLVIAHNANFDIAATEQALYDAGIDDPGIHYMDTLPLFQKHLQANSYKLCDLAALAGFEYKAHNAGADALALVRVLEYTSVQNGFPDINSLLYHDHVTPQFSGSNHFEPKESHQNDPEKPVPKRYPVHNRCDEEIIPVDADLSGLRFCITGEVPGLEREEVERLILQHGGRFTTTVSGKTDYLIVGEFDHPQYLSGKLKKAYELQDQGAKVKILRPAAFLQMIGKTE